MSGFPILDLVVGIIFIYFLLSIFCSSAVELWLTIRRTRARLLEQWLRRIFDSQALDSKGILLVDKNGKPVSVGQEIMNHCMVTALSPTDKSPSYINAGNFISALLDKITIAPVLTSSDAVQLPPKDLSEYITAIGKSTVISGELKRTILQLANEARQAAEVIKNIPAASNVASNITTGIKSDLDHFRERLEDWYNTNADRLTGTLKRSKIFLKTVMIATIITVALNVDSVEVCRYLYDHPEQSKELANKALSTYDSYKGRIDRMNNAADNSVLSDSVALKQLNVNTAQLRQDLDSLKALSLPIGWKNRNFSNDWKGHLAGWLATILAICLGAPFWFDILNKIANLRGTGPKPVVTDDSSVKK